MHLLCCDVTYHHIANIFVGGYPDLGAVVAVFVLVG